MRKIGVLASLFSVLIVTSACNSVWLPVSQRYEQEADALLASDRTSEALLAYYQAWTADQSNHSAMKKMIPLYRQQGRMRQADQFLHVLDDAERAGLEPAGDAGVPESAAGMEYLWLQTPVNGEPVGLAADVSTVVVAYGTGGVVLLNVADGSLLWNQSTGQTLTAEPVLTEHYVLIASETGKLTALNRKTGAQVWAADLPGAIYGSPIVNNDFVYAGSYGGLVTALSLSTGALLWQTGVVDPVVSQPLAAGDILYAGTTGGTVLALDNHTGKPVWDNPARLSGSLESQPVLADEILFVGGNDSRLYALALNGQDYYWQYSTSDSFYAAPLVDGSRLYAFSIGQTAAALDRITGDVIWHSDLPAPVRQTPVLSGTTLYFAGLSQPFLYQMDAVTGAITGQVNTGDWIETGPVLAGDNLLIAGKDGSVIAYRVN